jgi:hypothetical protein
MLDKKDLKILDRMSRSSVYENKFFKEKYELKWFYELKNRGYFKPNPYTIPERSRKDGFYYIPEWNVLKYLEKISNQVKQPGNKEFINELLNIIRDVTKYHINNDRILDNYRTWYYFVKILSNIPNERINNEIIELIPIWLDSRFETGLQGSEILKRLIPKFLDSNDKEDIEKAEKLIDIV